MLNFSEVLASAWEHREGPTVFGTVNVNGYPNLVCIANAVLESNDLFLIADNYFSKTKANILLGSKGSLLFVSPEGKAYQVKGRLERRMAGEYFDKMKTWNSKKKPGEAVVLLHVEEFYSGSKKLL